MNEIIDVVLDDGAFLPERAYEWDAGADLRSPVSARVIPLGSVVIDTGVHVEIPKGYAGFLFSKSGLYVKNNLTNTGLIDSGYTGSIKVKLINHGTEYYQIEKGDKISQLVISPVLLCGFHLVDNLGETDRGANGFGSTGR
jgi:dUTP pyrophosphatase